MGILGLLILVRPIGGSSTALLLVGLVLLFAVVLTALRISAINVRTVPRQALVPGRVGALTVGLVVIEVDLLRPTMIAVATRPWRSRWASVDRFGAAGIVGSFVGRVANQPLPLPGLIINSVLVVAGVALMFAGAAGSSSVDGIFNLVGILLIGAAVGLGGYAYLLRQQEPTGYAARPDTRRGRADEARGPWWSA